MERLSNKGLVTIIVGILMMGSIFTQWLSHVIDMLLVF